MGCPELKVQRTSDEMMDAVGPITKKERVKEGYHVMNVVDLRKSAASSNLGSQGVEEMKKVQEAIYHVRSFDDVDFRELADGHIPPRARTF